MTDVERLTVMSDEDRAVLAEQMRLANTKRFTAVLEALEPYIDGSMGAPVPGLVNAYVKTARELGLLWHSYDRPVPVEKVGGVDEELMVLAARQAQALGELEKLASLARRK